MTYSTLLSSNLAWPEKYNEQATRAAIMETGRSGTSILCQVNPNEPSNNGVFFEKNRTANIVTRNVVQKPSLGTLRIQLVKIRAEIMIYYTKLYQNQKINVCNMERNSFKSKIKVCLRNNNDAVHRQATFLIANPIAATCFGSTKQSSSDRMYKNM